MKYILYLYYIIFKIIRKASFFLYAISPLNKTEKEEKGKEEFDSEYAGIYAEKLFLLGELLYIACFLVLLYNAGVKQVELILHKENKYITLLVVIAIVLVFHYWFFDRNNRYKKYSAEFTNFTSWQKLWYGLVALILFWLPVIILITCINNVFYQ